MRRAIERTPDGRILQSDVVGELVGLSDQSALVAARSGTTEITLADVTVARLVPPSTAEELALERTMAAGWRAAESEPLGRWLLRASGGFTRRANSVLVGGQPDRPLDDALDVAAAWYAGRGLPLVLQVPAEARRLLDAELGERGWDFSGETQVLVRTVGDEPPRGGFVLHDSPTESWLALYRDGAAADDPYARSLLTNHPLVAFFESHDEAGNVVAIGRGAVDGDWLGISCVQVTADARRQGRATAIVGEFLHWGAACGATQAYAQVEDDNVASLALFESLGFWHHHNYRYRHAPVE